MAEEKPKRRGRKWIVLLAVLCAALLIGLWWWFGTGSTPVTLGPDTTVITSPLRPDGMPDYVAWLNEHYSQGVTPENNAAVLLLQAFGPPATISADVPADLLRQYGLPVLPATGDYFVLSNVYFSSHPPPTTAPGAPFDERAARDRVTAGPWTAADEPEMAAWLAANERPLALLAQAVERPRYFIPYHSNDPNFPILGMFLPSLGYCMEASRALTARAMLRLGGGDVEGAWADLMTIRRMVPLLEQHRTLIAQMVAVLVDGPAGKGTRALAASGRLSGAQARRLAAELAALPEIADLFEPFDGSERFGLLSMVVTWSRSPTLDLGPQTGASDQQVQAVSVDWNDVLRDINRQFDRAVRATKEPTYAARMAAMDSLEQDLKARRDAWLRETWWSRLIEKVGLSKAGAAKKPSRFRGSGEAADYLISTQMSGFSQALIVIEQARVNRSLDLLSLALAAYRAEKGEYPPALADLAPGYLKAVPEDSFAGKPLVYRKTADGYLLYSVGRNMTDDGGENDHRAGKDDIAVRVPAGK